MVASDVSAEDLPAMTNRGVEVEVKTRKEFKRMRGGFGRVDNYQAKKSRLLGGINYGASEFTSVTATCLSKFGERPRK